MFYSVIHRPSADISKIKKISAKYDPYYGLAGAHVTLLFPVPSAEISEANLISHISTLASSTQPFETSFNSFSTELSWDQWLFLTPTRGGQNFVNLHGAIYSGELKEFLREDIPFAPHIAIGHFARQNSGYDLKNPAAAQLDKERYQHALEEVKLANININYSVSEIELIGIDDNYQKSWSIRRFKLGQNWGEL